MTDDLRRLAEAATPGPWRATLSFVYTPAHAAENAEALRANTGGNFLASAMGTDRHANAAYIAACSPDRILALLDERDALRATLETVRQELVQDVDPDAILARLDEVRK